MSDRHLIGLAVIATLLAFIAALLGLWNTRGG